MLHSIKLKNKNTESSNKKAFFIEGGGTKGVYAIGVLKYLLDKNSYLNMNDVDIAGGTSVGSYIAICLSLGFKKEDYETASKKINLKGLTESGYWFLWTTYRLFHNGYLYNDAGRKLIVKNILTVRIDDIKKDLGEEVDAMDLTMGHLKKLISVKPDVYKHFIANSVDINRRKQIFFTTLDDKSLNIKISDVLLASSAIPLVFEPTILYCYPDGSYQYSMENEIEGLQGTKNQLVDGGTATNNPLDYFLIHDELYNKYELWLLKFSVKPTYAEINNLSAMFTNVIDYLITGKNDVKMKLIEEDYKINTINLKLTSGTLEIYDSEQIQKIIQEIYDKMKNGEIKVKSK